jgi:hypothetical protein
MIAAIVAPAGFLSIAMVRACLVFGPAVDLEGAAAGRLRDAGLPALRTFERVAAFGFDLGLVMRSSEVCATPSAAPPQPRPAKSKPAGQDPEAGWSRPSRHSNALFGLECQSILSKIVAAWVSQNGGRGFYFYHSEVRSLPPQPPNPDFGEYSFFDEKAPPNAGFSCLEKSLETND